MIEYDLDQVNTQLKQNFTSLAIIAFIHLKFGYVQPLLMQSIMGFKAFFMTKEARIHYLHGNTTTGELRRPFAVEGFWNARRQPKTDKGSIKRAEKMLKSQ